MIESVEKLSDKTIYWFGGNPRVGIIVCALQNCVTDEIATQYDLANSMLTNDINNLNTCNKCTSSIVFCKNCKIGDIK